MLPIINLPVGETLTGGFIHRTAALVGIIPHAITANR